MTAVDLPCELEKATPYEEICAEVKKRPEGDMTSFLGYLLSHSCPLTLRQIRDLHLRSENEDKCDNCTGPRFCPFPSTRAVVTSSRAPGAKGRRCNARVACHLFDPALVAHSAGGH